MSNNYKIKDATLRGIWSSLKTQATKCGVETENIKVKDYHTLIDNLNVSEYTDYDGESPAYEQSVPPTSKPIAKVKMVGGKSRKVVQNIPVSISGKTVDGITFTNNGDGSWTMTGVCPNNHTFTNLNYYGAVGGEKIKYKKGHKILIKLNSNSTLNIGVFVNSDINNTEYASQQLSSLFQDKIITIPETSVNYNWARIQIGDYRTAELKDVDIGTVTIKPQTFDLTEMYGAGNEPTTVEEFKKDFPNEYYGYTEGAIKHAQVDKLVSKSANRWTNGDITLKGNSLYSISLKAGEYTMSAFVTNDNDADTTCLCIINDIGYQFSKNKSNTINLVLDKDISAIRLYSSSNYNQSLSRTATWSNIKIYKAPYFNIENQIPTSVISKCTDYGVGINDTCYNYIDFVNKKYHRKVGSVDMGTLSWEYITSQSNPFFFSDDLKDKKLGMNLMCVKYLPTGLTPQTKKDKSIFGRTWYWSVYNTIIQDSSYTDATTFKNAMSGQILYYELATEEIIDLSDVLDDNFYRIKVEEGGTLTFHHPEADNGYIIKVPNQVTYKVNLDEIEASLTSEYANSLTEVI